MDFSSSLIRTDTMKWFMWRVSFPHCKSINIILYFMCIPCRKRLEIRVSAIQIVECLSFQIAFCSKFKYYKKINTCLQYIDLPGYYCLFVCWLIGWFCVFRSDCTLYYTAVKSLSIFRENWLETVSGEVSTISSFQEFDVKVKSEC